jgi:D-alanine-D-alanine ligase
MTDKLVVLFGGSSSERKVSVASAQNMLGALEDAEGWFLGMDGKVYVPSPERVKAHAQAFKQEFDPGTAAEFRSLEEALAVSENRSKVYVLAVHGGDGENGQLQRVLENAKVAFTASGSEASARAFDKVEAKRIAQRAGLRVAPAEVVAPEDESSIRSSLEKFFQTHGECIAKPVADGSSVGLFRLRQKGDAVSAARDIAQRKVAYLLEPFLQGAELTVGVVDWPEGCSALPVSEVRLEAEVQFDYDAKYLGRGSREITPAEIPDSLAQQVKALAVTAHQALGCYGYSRTDVIATKDGPYFLETNSLPGMTKASFIPQQLEAAGKSVRDFLRIQIQLAVARRNKG